MMSRLNFWRTRRTSVLIASAICIVLFAGMAWLTIDKTVIEPRNRNAATRSAKSYAKSLLVHPNARHGSETNWSALNKLWQKESGWNYRARNPTSSAAGIPQMMLSVHYKNAHKRTAYLRSYRVQIRAGLRYIWVRYGNPTRAWAHSRSRGWY